MAVQQCTREQRWGICDALEQQWALANSSQVCHPTVEGMRSPVVFERCMVGQHGIGSHPGSDSHRIGDRCSRVDAGRHRNKELTTYSDESTSPNVLVQKRITRWCRRRHIAIVSSRKLAVREHTVSIDELSNSHLNLSIDIYVGYL